MTWVWLFMISDFVSWGLWSQFLPEMCAIYKVSRRKIERGVSWPVRQKASEACNLFLLQAGTIRPSPLGAIHRGDGHICFLCTLQQYVLVFRNYWMFSKYFLFQVGSTRPTGVLPNGRVSGKYATSGKIYPRKNAYHKPLPLVFGLRQDILYHFWYILWC